jgi:nucleotidyltransferase/DNA polymerase involved in DNA repair
MSARNNRILHIDGDLFFASCKIALNPKLEGRPVWLDGIVIAADGRAKNMASRPARPVSRPSGILNFQDSGSQKIPF